MDVVHYKAKKAECIDVIRDALTDEEFAGFCKGNVIKYLYREGNKDSASEDRRKAADYACMLSSGMWLDELAESLLPASEHGF